MRDASHLTILEGAPRATILRHAHLQINHATRNSGTDYETALDSVRQTIEYYRTLRKDGEKPCFAWNDQGSGVGWFCVVTEEFIKRSSGLRRWDGK